MNENEYQYRRGECPHISFAEAQQGGTCPGCGTELEARQVPHLEEAGEKMIPHEFETEKRQDGKEWPKLVPKMTYRTVQSQVFFHRGI